MEVSVLGPVHCKLFPDLVAVGNSFQGKEICITKVISSPDAEH